MFKPHKLTKEEIREKFLRMCWENIEYWDKLPDKTTRERLEGLVLSILVALDGDASLPAFIVAPTPIPGDKKNFQARGENWFPENDLKAVEGDIAGLLQQTFWNFKPARESAASRDQPLFVFFLERSFPKIASCNEMIVVAPNENAAREFAANEESSSLWQSTNDVTSRILGTADRGLNAGVFQAFASE